nr:sigma factor [Amycolatopsis rubida]
MAENVEATSVFAQVRRRLFGIGHRILGSVADAEDVWLRWQTCDRSVVRNPGAFLATTTTRLAITARPARNLRWPVAARTRRHLRGPAQIADIVQTTEVSAPAGQPGAQTPRRGTPDARTAAAHRVRGRRAPRRPGVAGEPDRRGRGQLLRWRRRGPRDADSGGQRGHGGEVRPRVRRLVLVRCRGALERGQRPAPGSGQPQCRRRPRASTACSG